MDLADLSALLGEDLAAETFSDIWVVLPGHEAATPAGAAVLAEARRLADALGCYVHAVLSDDAAAPAAVAFGADRAHITADAVEYVSGQNPEFVLLPAGLNALAARLAQRLDSGLITAVTAGLDVDPDTRALRGSRPVYGGDYLLDLAVTSPVKIATLDTATLPAAYADPGRTGETLISDLPAPEPHARDLGRVDYHPPAWRPLSKGRVIVSIGRGLGEAAGVAQAQALASRLGGELAGDRSARDSGWIDEAHEVGVTGQEVAPDLYLALGILGDTIHNAAITGARRVIAVHANPAAPIFQAADVCVVAEPSAVLPALLAALG
ncbi:MAG: electron transfer flavoprotein subunit alpha/FixB family protein [Anaerolineales bacterium]|nr:electron transfer flavoprotein subunit alpha/FixB family protein [Anaerolineales bacterium]